MIIEIKNFGPIKYLKIDLDKDLHLIYGKNAIGKSYAIYCLYCLLKSFKNVGRNTGWYRKYLELENDSIISFESILDELKKENSKTNISKLYSAFFVQGLKNNVVKEFQNSILNTFSSIENLKNRYSRKDFEITISIPESDVCKKIVIFSNKTKSLDLKIELENENFEVIKKKTTKTKYSVALNGKKLFGVPTLDKMQSEFLTYTFRHLSIFYDEINMSMREIYFLPASRSGLYQALNSFAPIIAELTQNRFFIKSKKIELPSLSEPLSDYFIDLSTIDRKYINKEFESFISTLEENILKGKVELNEKTKNITYRPNGLDIELNLSEASSMVAELSPLVLYLKHIINHKFTSKPQGLLQSLEPKKNEKLYDIIFIEEPEAHLHPELQVALMKVFAKLTKHNLKIFVTSHSNYMFNELNNLILDKEIDAKKIAVYHLIQTEDGTIQNPEMKVTDDGIYDDNFQETSEKLYEERMRILEEAE